MCYIAVMEMLSADDGPRWIRCGYFKYVFGRAPSNEELLLRRMACRNDGVRNKAVKRIELTRARMAGGTPVRLVHALMDLIISALLSEVYSDPAHLSDCGLGDTCDENCHEEAQRSQSSKMRNVSHVYMTSIYLVASTRLLPEHARGQADASSQPAQEERNKKLWF
jgi:hypothetical protein